MNPPPVSISYSSLLGISSAIEFTRGYLRGAIRNGQISRAAAAPILREMKIASRIIPIGRK